MLAEGAVTWRGTGLALRAERTVRPEEERLLDFFRAARPHTDASILGRTRWDVLTAHVGFPAVVTRVVRVEPLLELARSRATEATRPSAFAPALFFGSDRQWSASAGLRVGLGPTHHRMGRYGVAEPAGGHTAHDGHDRQDSHETHDRGGSGGAHR
jgi:hypothetical protein